QRTVERAESVRESRLQRATRIIERAGCTFNLEIGQRPESVGIDAVGGVMHHGEANDVAVDSIDVRELALYSTRMRDREFGVHRRVEVLFGEQPPVRDDSVVFLAGQLGTPGPVVESFVAPEEQR